jgi:hypothetical protein
MLPELPEIPAWIPYFVLGGIAFIIVVVPLKILWEATTSRRERSQKVEKFLDRLRERFNEVSFRRGIIGPSRVTFKHNARKVTLWIADLDELVVQLDENISCKMPMVVKTKGRWTPKWALLGLRPLPRVLTHDSMIDDAVAIYATAALASYLYEVVQFSVTKEGKPSEVADSLIVLRRAPGVRKFRLTMTPEGPLRIRLRLSTEDMLYRPDQLESVIHHLQRLYDTLVAY